MERDSKELTSSSALKTLFSRQPETRWDGRWTNKPQIKKTRWCPDKLLQSRRLIRKNKNDSALPSMSIS